jgi:hypothetical protein
MKTTEITKKINSRSAGHVNHIVIASDDKGILLDLPPLVRKIPLSPLV